ncbi:MAG: VOC family protein [Gemmatimonadales bacterium]
MPMRLHSAAIFVSDMDRALVFYRDHLGLPLEKLGSFGAEFLDGETRLGVHPAVHPEAKAMVGRHTGLTFHTEDLVAVCEGLRARGANVVAEPSRTGFGIMALVADPDGNVIALWEDKFPDGGGAS